VQSACQLHHRGGPANRWRRCTSSVERPLDHGPAVETREHDNHGPSSERRFVPSKGVVARWRVLAGFWPEKARAGGVVSLISVCAAANARKGYFRALIPCVRARSEGIPTTPTRLRRPFPSFLNNRRGRAARRGPPPHRLPVGVKFSAHYPIISKIAGARLVKDNDDTKIFRQFLSENQNLSYNVFPSRKALGC